MVDPKDIIWEKNNPFNEKFLERHRGVYYRDWEQRERIKALALKRWELRKKQAVKRRQQWLLRQRRYFLRQ